MQLTVDDGDCPAGMVVGAPDFDKDSDGDQDSILLRGGKSASAVLRLDIAAASFTRFNRKAPARCTLLLMVEAPGFDDPAPSNNSVPLEINVFDANDSDQSAVHQSFVTSLKPVALSIRRGADAATKTIKVKAGNADILAEAEEQGDLLTVTALDGTCPAATVGAVDYDAKTSGDQNVATVEGGKVASGKLIVTAAAGEVATASSKSPARCIATISVAGPGGDSEASNDTTSLVIDVYDKND